MITTIYSSRVYYNDLSDNDVKVIHHDIRLYHSMKNHAYNVLYNNFHNITNDSITSTELKKMYGTNDYTSLSAISEAKGVFKSNITWNKKTIENMISASRKIQKKIKKEKKELDKCLACLDSLIEYSRTGKASIKKIPKMKWKKKDPVTICSSRIIVFIA